MKPEEVAEQVIYKFVKKIYNEECEAKKKEKLTHQEIVELVNKTYEEKEKSLRKKIKSAIKTLCTPKEMGTDEDVEKLLKKIFEDPEFNKTKITQEVEVQQKIK